MADRKTERGSQSTGRLLSDTKQILMIASFLVPPEGGYFLHFFQPFFAISRDMVVKSKNGPPPSFFRPILPLC